ncbi:MAG: SEL1-like repeat protein [Rhodocyclaceae bacterium]|nr:SEL1-like repeat protein [Rhodocyclaceae bacterium]
MYGKGLGTTRDLNQANKWMRAAADQGFQKAVDL